MTDSTCDWHNCTRPATEEDGWSNRFCHGHMIVGRANKDAQGDNSSSADEYNKLMLKALAWFEENPRV